MEVKMSDFREKFLFGLAECGVSPEEFGAHLLREREKQAAVIFDPNNLTAAVSSALLDIPTLATVALPTAAAAFAGPALYNLNRPSNSAMIKRVKEKELIKELQAQIVATQGRIRRRARSNQEFANDRTVKARPA
jgi:hypothetical protein